MNKLIIDNKEYFIEDQIVANVCLQLVERSQVGIKKYNTTLIGNTIDVVAWVKHLQEELLDAANYAEMLKTKLTKNNNEN